MVGGRGGTRTGHGIVPGNKDSEAGGLPSKELLGELVALRLNLSAPRGLRREVTRCKDRETCWPPATHGVSYSTTIFAPRRLGLDRCSIRLSITARMALRNSMREFLKCSPTSGDTPKDSRTCSTTSRQRQRSCTTGWVAFCRFVSCSLMVPPSFRP